MNDRLLQRIEHFNINGKAVYQCNIAFDKVKINGFVSNFGSSSMGANTADTNTYPYTAIVDRNTIANIGTPDQASRIRSIQQQHEK